MSGVMNTITTIAANAPHTTIDLPDASQSPAFTLASFPAAQRTTRRSQPDVLTND